MFIIKAKLYEYIGIISFGITLIIIFLILNKLTLIVALDCFVGPILLLNVIMCIINYKKNKNIINLLLMIAQISIFISDLSIALSMVFNPNIVLVNISCMLTWPTYVIGCALLNYYYTNKRKKSEIV